MTMKFFLLSLAIIVFGAVPVQAQLDDMTGTNNAAEKKEPIEISAEQTLEWDQNKKQYIANGSVIVTQGTLTINADKMIADYDDEGENGDTNITNLTATGNVIIENQESTATGDNATYDLNSGQAVLTGDDLKLITPEQTITATESLEYNSKQKTAKAVGNATITTPKETLKAQTINATFIEKDGKQILNTAQTIGGIRIETKEEVITGNKGTYNAQKEVAEIIGNVKVTKGPNQLVGDKAEVNLKTGVSRMLGGSKTDGRVKGIFYPESNNNELF